MFLYYPHTVHKIAARGTVHTLRRLAQIQPEQGKVPYFSEVEYSAVDQRYAWNHFYRKIAFAQISPLSNAGVLPCAAGSFYNATKNHALTPK